METFDDDYAQLETEFERQACSDGDVFIPMLKPASKVDFILVGSEPSFNRWAKSTDHARRKVARGYRNSATTIEDFVFHHAVSLFLGNSYYVTDLSKGAMTVRSARRHSEERYNHWWDLFTRECDLVSHPNTLVFPLGDTVTKYLAGKLAYAIQLPHFSGQAVASWKKIVAQRPIDEYQAFASTITLQQVITTARAVMISAGMNEFVDETVGSMQVLPESRKWLAYAYKVKIEEWQNGSGKKHTVTTTMKVGAADQPAITEDSWKSIVTADDLEFVDKRAQGGCLWIIGGRELDSNLPPLGF